MRLIFIDTNILLDFYRVRGRVALNLLSKLERVIDRVVGTYVCEVEYNNNRHAAILEGASELKAITAPINVPAILSETKELARIRKSVSTANEMLGRMRNNVDLILRYPERRDPVYKFCRSLFNNSSDLFLSAEHELRDEMGTRALVRFREGFPPRKRNDTSYSDSMNWEWILHVCQTNNADIDIISRDGDYGHGNNKYSAMNDWLRTEFKRRVGQRRTVRLFKLLTEALKEHDVKVPVADAKAEAEAVSRITPPFSRAITIQSLPSIGSVAYEELARTIAGNVDISALSNLTATVRASLDSLNSSIDMQAFRDSLNTVAHSVESLKLKELAETVGNLRNIVLAASQPLISTDANVLAKLSDGSDIQ